MPRRKDDDTKTPDLELDREVHRAMSLGVTLNDISARGGVTRTTLWKWRKGIYSPVMRDRTRVMEAIKLLVNEKLEGAGYGRTDR